MRILSALVSIPILLCFSLRAQEDSIECELAWVDLLLADQAIEAFDEHGLSEELKMKSKHATKVLGNFKVPIQEEAFETKSFPIPGTDLFATATVGSTDELAPWWLIILALAASEAPVENARTEEESAVSETPFTIFTYMVRLAKHVKVEGRKFSLSLICKCMSLDEFKKRFERLPPVDEITDPRQ